MSISYILARHDAPRAPATSSDGLRAIDCAGKGALSPTPRAPSMVPVTSPLGGLVRTSPTIADRSKRSMPRTEDRA
jgi:hypothetical protein